MPATSGRVLSSSQPGRRHHLPRDDTAKGRATRYTIVDEVPKSQVEWAWPAPVYATVYDDWDNDNENPGPGIFGRLKAWFGRR